MNALKLGFLVLLFSRSLYGSTESTGKFLLKSANKETSRIGIIGAGPAGIDMARRLDRAGFKNIKILEKNDRIGGKSFTLQVDVGSATVPHDMGTCYMHPKYENIRELLSEYYRDSNGQASSLRDTECRNDKFYFVEEPYPQNTEDPFLVSDRRTWQLAAVAKIAYPSLSSFAGSFFYNLQLLPGLTVGSNIRKYSSMHRERFGKDFTRYSFPVPESIPPQYRQELQLNAIEWLQLHKLDSLAPLLKFAMSAQGYGLLRTMSAYHMLVWVSADMLEGILDAVRSENPFMKWFYGIDDDVHPAKATLVHGFQDLWERIAQSHGFLNGALELNTSVNKIIRADDKVLVSAESTGDGEKINKHYEFDIIFIAAPIKPLIQYNVLDANDKEFGLFDSQHPFILTTTLFKMNPKTEKEFNLLKRKFNYSLLFKPNLMEPEHSGEVHALRCPNIELEQEGQPQLDPSERWKYQIAYQFVDGYKASLLDPQDSSKLLYGPENLMVQFHHWLANQGISDATVINQFFNLYFYHWEGKDVYKVWDLIQMQGERNTFFIGASAVDFESVLNVVGYNAYLEDQFFP